MQAPIAPRRPLRTLALMGVSGLGLVLLGLVGLLGQNRTRAADARAAMRAEAQELAEALRAALRSPELWILLPPEYRFQAEGQRLRAPELRTAAAPEPDWRVRAAEERLAQLEGQRLIEEARAHLQRSLSLELPGPDRATLLLIAAWFESRQGEDAHRDAHLDALAAVGDALQEIGTQRLQSLLLLLARSGRELPGWAADAIAQGDITRARALLELLNEAAPLSADRRRQIEDRIARLARLRDAQQRAPIWAMARAPLHVALRESGKPPRELLYWPSSSHGALLPSSALFRHLRELHRSGETRLGADFARARWRAEPVLRNARLDELPLAPGLALRPAAPESDRASSIWILLLTLGLASAFGFGLWSSLRAMRREREALATRGRFLQTVTHELRTPLASIRMFSEMLRDGRVSSDAKRDEYHRLLASESERLSALVANVLDSSRIGSGGRSFDKRKLSVVELLTDLDAMLVPFCAREGVEYRRESVGTVEVEGTLEADRDALVQALWNLIDNALKYGREGGTLILRAGRDGEQLRLDVVDRGPGIPEGERERVFGAFARGSDAEREAQSGLGLGLFLARSLIEAQGGTLSSVQVDRGACLRITLPLISERETRETSR